MLGKPEFLNMTYIAGLGAFIGYKILKVGGAEMWTAGKRSRLIETGKRIVLSNRNASNSGQYLLCRTERHGLMEVSAG